MRLLDGRATRALQFSWGSRRPPVLSVESGETVRVRLPDSSSGQLSRRSTTADLRRLDLGRVDAASGPIRVEGARPGDTLRVSVVALEVGDWGWSGVFRDFGLLKGRFDDALVTWRIREGVAEPLGGFLRPVRVPVRPMLGWVGVAPPTGELGMIPPQRFGGNMDNRRNGVGTTVELPVQVDGALLSLGDPHAAQGDGEVCGTGIETPATATVRLELLKGRTIPAPRGRVAHPPRPTGPELMATGVGPDLHGAATQALEGLLALLGESGWTEREAYLLASVAGNLAVAEIVDEPNFVVAMTLPERLARGGRR